MKERRMLTAVGALVALTSISGIALAHGNAQSDAQARVGRARVVIHYGRPELRGRDPLKLISPGEPWRLGADVPTTFETDSALDFGGTRVAKGKYYLLAVLVQGGEWALVVSRQPIDQYEPSAKVAQIPLAFSEGGPSVEEMTIHLAGRGQSGRIEIQWGTMRLTGSFSAAK